MEARSAGAGGGLRTMRRKAVEATKLVETSFLPGREESMPIVVTPAVDNVDLPAWCAAHLDDIDNYLDRYGAILFRGFDLTGAPDFEAVASSVVPDLFAEYGDLPPEEAGQRIYGVTPYPPDKTILFHNESSHLSTWPMRQFFFCEKPAPVRGETPLLDCREVANKLDPAIVDEFDKKGLMYVRNFSEGIDVNWTDFFHTEDKAEVEKVCAEVTKGVRIHPRTGEKIFFNQVQLHHVSCLDDETRTALRQLFADEDLPRNVYYGDGTPISDETIATIGECYEELCVEFPWQRGDLVAVDNMIVSHARRPYEGERKHLVAMGAMVNAAD
jgi:alpha-ketoglutarate-dependent taurine dioxygenase